MTREEFIEAHSNLFWYTPEAKKKNYYPEIYHFFSLVLSKYTQEESAK